MKKNSLGGLVSKRSRIVGAAFDGRESNALWIMKRKEKKLGMMEPNVRELDAPRSFTLWSLFHIITSFRVQSLVPTKSLQR